MQYNEIRESKEETRQTILAITENWKRNWNGNSESCRTCREAPETARNSGSRSLHFGKSVHDNGWGMFTTFLKYKLEEEGKQLIRIDKWFPSSQTCSVCGYKNPEIKDLRVREGIVRTAKVITIGISMPRSI